MAWRAAVVGSGPNGLVAANRLAQVGAEVTLFEADEAVGVRCVRLSCSARGSSVISARACIRSASPPRL
ncbi:NAD(P)-binding protein [Nesterenkonia pannonica]|uniref:NAD(P)-binding protein n=1 Tax=Nesterenkonia pannonica TaxID=1548602 RepID=UPI002164E957|nr:NAD(P)-binding protein [Nesterenkonia pannonica]